jgi:hypothetical protein
MPATACGCVPPPEYFDPSPKKQAVEETVHRQKYYPARYYNGYPYPPVFYGYGQQVAPRYHYTGQPSRWQR